MCVLSKLQQTLNVFYGLVLMWSPMPCAVVSWCSKLWGCKGELADPPGSLGAQRLMDWSYAGYMAGEAPIPKLPLVGTVKDFGAVGDGVADDTQVRCAAGIQVLLGMATPCRQDYTQPITPSRQPFQTYKLYYEDCHL